MLKILIGSLMLSSICAHASTESLLDVLLEHSPIFLVSDELNNKECPSQLNIEIGQVWSNPLNTWNNSGVSIRSERDSHQGSVIETVFDQDMVNASKKTSRHYDFQYDIRSKFTDLVKVGPATLSVASQDLVRNGILSRFPLKTLIKKSVELTMSRMNSHIQVEYVEENSDNEKAMKCVFALNH